jgi:hypothetical protein
MNIVKTSIEHGLQRIARFVEYDLEHGNFELKESLELSIIKTVIDNYRINAERNDYQDFLNDIVDYCVEKS